MLLITRSVTSGSVIRGLAPHGDEALVALQQASGIVLLRRPGSRVIGARELHEGIHRVRCPTDAIRQARPAFAALLATGSMFHAVFLSPLKLSVLYQLIGSRMNSS